MTAPLRVGFTGYYGMRNFGDDLFGVLCAASARRFWQAEPLLIGPGLQGAPAGATWPTHLPAAMYGSPGPLGKAARWYGFARGLRESDVLVMGGGSVITARESFRKPMMLSAQRSGRLQLAAVGVSVGPFADDREQDIAADFVRHFSYLSVRDRRSWELAQRMGVQHIAHHGRDLAGLLQSVIPAPARGATAPDTDRRVPRIGLAPCRYTVRSDHPAPTPAQWHEAALRAIVQMASRGPLEVEVFSLNGHPQHGDAAMARELEQRLRASGISVTHRPYLGGDPLGMVQNIRACDAFISARLHGAIVAYLCSVPFAIVDYHPKCRDFANDIGLPAPLRITADSRGDDAFMQVLETLLNGDGAHARLSPDLYAQQAQDIFQCAPWSTRSPSTTQAA